MGVDIHGRNPILLKPKPVRENFNTNSSFYDAVRDWERANPGDYFGTNFWTWRPIYAVMQQANEKFGLGLDLYGLGENSGFGLKTQGECNLLADALEKILDIYDSDSIQVCYGSWSDLTGKRLTEEEIDSLNQDYPRGTILYTGIAMSDKIAISNHYAHIQEFKDFINFLRNCGGFEVW